MKDSIDRPLTYRFENKSDRDLARESSRSLSPFTDAREAVHACFSEGNVKVEVTLPPVALRQLVDILVNMARGEAITIMPVNRELTTQQAADILNVSRPFFVRLLDEDKIPFHKVGKHRRVKFKDLLEFKSENDRARDADMEELADEAQKMGLV